MDRRGWIAVGIVAAAAVAFLALFFVPEMRAISQSLADLESRITYVLEAQKSARVGEQLQHQLDEVRAYNVVHERQLMSPDDLPALFSQISQISKDNEAVTTKFEPHPPVNYHSFHKVSLSLGVHGPFSAIHGLVRDLEALPMRIWIDEMKIRGPSEPGKPVQCDVLLVVFVDNPEKTD